MDSEQPKRRKPRPRKKKEVWLDEDTVVDPSEADDFAVPEPLQLWIRDHTDSRHMAILASAIAIYLFLFGFWLFLTSR
jgi:hypothetical protein